jgi:polysaccharide biosynthesis/export protein VpsN
MQILSLMNVKNIPLVRLNLLLVATLLSLGLTGCSTTNLGGVMDEPGPDTNSTLPRLHVGDTVTITFTGLPAEEDQTPQEKPIKEDGTISLPYVDHVQAAGKTAGELEDAIHDRYVPAYYTHLSVTVKITSDRVYFVRGEVKSPGRLIYAGPITVTRAIDSAGDFSDFANRKKIVLIRANGQRFKLNADKILNGDAPDPPVFPGDQVEVERRLW